jgi:transposase InsO family protein
MVSELYMELKSAGKASSPPRLCQKPSRLNLINDNGSQPTARSFMEICAGLEIKPAFTARNNPKSDADTKRKMRTLKRELCRLQKWHSRYN